MLDVMSCSLMSFKGFERQDHVQGVCRLDNVYIGEDFLTGITLVNRVWYLFARFGSAAVA